MAKIGVVKRKSYRNTGIETFQKNVCEPLLEKENTEALEYQIPDHFPLSVTIGRLYVGRKIKNAAKRFDTVFVPSQTLMTVNPENVDAKVVPYVHDLFPVTTNFSGWLATPLGKHYTNNIEKCDEVVCSSKTVEKELRNRTGFTGESRVVYQGVETPEVEEADERDIDLIYVGSLIPRKNPDMVRETIEAAMDEGYKVVAVNFEELDLPCETRTDVTDEELFKLYGRSRYYLHLSKAEGFGRTPVEAQSMGCQPLALDNDINKEILRTGYHPVETVSDVLEYLSEQPKFSEESKKNASNYNWPETVKQIYEVIS